MSDQEMFDRFLFWLDPNREEAAIKYEAIRRKLIKIFTCRGCIDAEDLADVTIDSRSQEGSRNSGVLRRRPCAVLLRRGSQSQHGALQKAPRIIASADTRFAGGKRATTQVPGKMFGPLNA